MEDITLMPHNRGFAYSTRKLGDCYPNERHMIQMKLVHKHDIYLYMYVCIFMHDAFYLHFTFERGINLDNTSYSYTYDTLHQYYAAYNSCITSHY